MKKIALLIIATLMAAMFATNVSAQETFELGEFNYEHDWAPRWNADGVGEESYPLPWETVQTAAQLVVELSTAPAGSIELVMQSDGNNWWGQATVYTPEEDNYDARTITINLADIDGWDAFIDTENPGRFGLSFIGDILVGAHLVLGEAPAAPVAILAPVAVDGQNVLHLVSDSTTYTLNGVQGTLEVPLMNINDRNLIPFRFIGEIMGATVTHTPATATTPLVAHFSLDGIELSIPMGQTIYHNGVDIGTPDIVNDRTLVPVRVAEMMGAEVSWEPATRAVSIRFTTGQAEAPTEEAEEPAYESEDAPDADEEEAEDETEEVEEVEEDAEEDDAPAQPSPDTMEIEPAAGYVLSHTHGTNWGSARLTFNFSDDDWYTISFMVMHNSTEFGVMPTDRPGGGYNFTVGGEEVGFLDSPSGEWVPFAITFPGSQTTGAIDLSTTYPRTSGVTFYLDNVVITNSAGDVVFSNDFEDDLEGFSIREWSEDRQNRVAKP